MSWLKHYFNNNLYTDLYAEMSQSTKLFSGQTIVMHKGRRMIIKLHVNFINNFLVTDNCANENKFKCLIYER